MFQSLERRSGLPIAFNPKTGELSWPDSIGASEYSERTAAEMESFVADPKSRASSDPIYRVYRNLARTADVAAIRHASLRYDITVIPPGSLVSGEDFFRTAGHYHSQKPGTATSYPEVYEVISGRAYWILQRPRKDDSAIIEEVYAVEAGPGEKGVMLPGFGHISVNAFSEPLVMANWINDSFTYDYEPYRKLRGSAYWLLEGALRDAIEFERNSNYRAVPELEKLRPREHPALGLTRREPLYALVQDLTRLRFLSDPEAFTGELTLDRCYRTVV